ncbi:MAG: protein kinase [Planctomycetes bacterium]|nr:protein kinase [Planctomycetota bacterium]
MREYSGNTPDPVRLSVQRRVDQVCVPFEAAWRTGKRPEIEKYLGDTSEPDRSVLLQELLRLEWEYRRRAGEVVFPEEYRKRFPEHRALMDALFKQTPAAATPTPRLAVTSAWEPSLGTSSSRENLVQPLETDELRKPAGNPLDQRSGQTQVEIPGYNILYELGRGGMGIVYKARKLDSQQEVALKTILSGRNPDIVEMVRFCVEAMAFACLNHPNIIKVDDMGYHNGHVYISLEYAPGGSLADLIRKTPQDPGWSAQVVKTIALALDYAHQRSILHRDLKPANILITSDKILKVTDFGLAKSLRSWWEVTKDYMPDGHATALDQEWDAWLREYQAALKTEDPKCLEPYEENIIASFCGVELARTLGPYAKTIGKYRVTKMVKGAKSQLGFPVPQNTLGWDHWTRTGMIMGTPAYMAPEQACGTKTPIGPFTDVYALGAILYELLSGHPPFEGKTVWHVLAKVKMEAPTFLEPKVPKDLQRICLRCLEKLPENRYQRAAELALDLQRFLEGKR